MRAAAWDSLRIVGSFAIAAACAGLATALVGGCSLKNCDGSVVDAPPGHVLDDSTWESSPIDGTYLDFPGQRVYHFWPINDGHFTGTFTSIVSYVSPDPTPNLNNSNMTLASGNLAEIQTVTADPTHGDFFVHNDTCAQYYLRVVVTRVPPPPPPDAGPADAAADAAAAADAGADAVADAPAD